MWVMAVVGDAPCQCFSPGGNQTTSPGRISSIGPPHRCSQAAAGGDDQRLAERMGMPGGAGTGLEGDRVAGGAGRLRTGEQRVDADGAGEPVGRALSRTAASRFA